MSLLQADIYELTGPRQLHLKRETIDLDVIGPTEVVARTIVSVISPGTEIAAYIGAPPLRPMKVYPRVNGYCNVAEVLAVGSKVEGIRVGDRISTHQSHRTAFKCDQSRVNAVLKTEDDAVSQATLYLWHLGYYPLLRAKATAGTNVAIVGLGALGLAAIAAAKLAGCNVVGLSHRESACEQGIQFGASAVTSRLSDVESLKSWLNRAFAGIGADLVISTSNSWQDWKIALEIVRDGGDIAVLGFPGRGLSPPDFNPLDSRYIYDKELTILACGNPPSVNVSPRDIRFTLSRNYTYLSEMIRRNRLPVPALVSEKVDWRDLDGLYRRMADREPGLITAALQWQ